MPTNPRICKTLLLSMVLMPFSVRAEEPPNAKLSIGFASVDITPRLGTPMAGYYSPRGAEGVHDPLLAKAMVLHDGETKLALVSLDLIKTTDQFVKQARELISTQTGIPPDHVMIGATHSHTGPIIISESAREDDFGGKSTQAQEYIERLPSWIAEAVKEADKQLRPIEVSMTTGRCEGVAFNRRFHLRNGTVGWNPGKLNPLIVRPAGPVDEDLPIMLFTGADGKREAAMVNYSIHLDTVGGTDFSADIPGHLSRMVADAVHPDFFTLYFTACCGDVNHIDVSRGGSQKGHAEATRIGTRLAAATLQSMDDAKPVASIRLASASRVVPLRSFAVTEADIVAAREILERQRAGSKPAPTFREIVAAYRAIDVEHRGDKPWDAEVQVFAIGNQAAIVSLPGEIFVEIGVSIRQGSPFPLTAVAELANGSLGYIPNRVAYPQGEYEVISARVAEGSGEQLVDAALDILKALYREEAARP